MKNRITHFLTLAALLLLGGCAQEISETAPVADGQPLRFSAAGTGSTRTVVDTDAQGNLLITWAEADEVGIYGISDNRPMGSNYAYVASPQKSDATRCTFSAKESSAIFKWVNGAKQSYYAYYPYTEIRDREPEAAAHPVTLPAVQLQSKGNSAAHLAKYGVMTAAPVDIAASGNGGSSICFQFANIFSIVELRFKMDAATSIAAVPIKQVKLTSSTADLAIGSATIDLTQPIDPQQPLPLTIAEASRSVTVNFGENPNLNKANYTSVYLLVAPGSHPQGSLNLELTAIDNSVNSLTLPTDALFKSNRHYVREFVLSLDQFEQANEFDAEIPQLSCKVGEPLTIEMTGVADQVDFWSGEEGHDYAYSTVDRMQEARLSINLWTLLQNGYQRTPVKVKYSTDFDGTMTEDNILAATWHDVTSQFIIPTHLYGVDDGNTVVTTISPTSSGTVDCSSWFTGEGNSCHIALFYHIDKYNANWVDPVAGTVTGNGRTYFYLYDLWVRSQYKSETSYTEIFRHQYVKGESNPAYPVFVAGASINSEDTTNPINVYKYTPGGVAYNSVVRLGAAFRPVIDKDSYLVMPKLTRPGAKNVGKDTSLTVKALADAMPESYAYTFSAPGTYHVVVVGTAQSLSGPKKIIREADITVTAE